MRPVFAFLSVTCLLSGCALTDSAPASKLSSPAVESPITEADIRAHMNFLASDALNGRASGSRDEWIAASYLAAQMQQWGLEPLGDGTSFVQQIEIQRSETVTPPTLSAAGKTFTHGKEMRVNALSSARVSGLLQKYTNGASIAVGSVILIPPAPSNTTGSALAAIPGGLATLSAAAAILVPENPNGPRPPPTARIPTVPARVVGVQSTVPPRPSVITLTSEAYGVISSLPEGSPIEMVADVKTAPSTHSWNAIGRVTGSDPAAAKEVIVLSAHLDHIGVRANAAAGTDAINNGADDDASGTIAVLELARALSLGPRPKRTIVFAFFGSEEAGGFGSSYFADKPVVPLTDIVANLQFEMIGRPDDKVAAHTLWLTGYERSTLGPALTKQGAKLVQDPHPEANFFERSDNIQFARRGVVAHTVSSYGLHKDYHQPSDEIQTIDFPHLTDAIRSMLEPIRWLANSDFKPAWLPGKKP